MTKAFRRLTATALCAAAGFVAAPGAMAAGMAGTGTQFQAERAMCDHINQDRAACLREAGAAAQASRQGALTSADPSTYMANALQRCQLQPPEDRSACEDRVRGTGVTSIDGSVLGGGAIRETVTPVPAPVRVY